MKLPFVSHVQVSLMTACNVCNVCFCWWKVVCLMRKILISVWTFALPFQEVSVIKRNNGKMHAVVNLHFDHRCEDLDLIRSVWCPFTILQLCHLILQNWQSLFLKNLKLKGSGMKIIQYPANKCLLFIHICHYKMLVVFFLTWKSSFLVTIQIRLE